MSFSLRMNWTDPRVKAKMRSSTERLAPLHRFFSPHSLSLWYSCSLLHCSLYYGDVNSRLLDKVWVPSVILHNLKKEEKKGVLNIPTLLNMAVKEDGAVLVDMSLFTKPTITCNMDFSLFPFDVQHCRLLIQVNFYQ